MSLLPQIQASLQQSIVTKQSILTNENLLAQIEQSVEILIAAFKNGNALLLCGNGGSAADAQHIAAEFVARYNYDRPPLNAEALGSNASDLTCIGNDYGFEHIFSRSIQAKGRKGDVLMAISTSGNSPNVLAAALAAKDKGMTVISLTGETGGDLKKHSHLTLQIPSKSIPHIQESHITIAHIICGLVEAGLFPKK